MQKVHEDQYQSLLKNIIQPGPSPSVDAAAAAQEENKEEDGGAVVAPEFQTFESVAKLQESEEILTRCASEVTGIEIVKTKSGKVFLVSEKKRILPKHTLLGGFGTGKCLGWTHALPIRDSQRIPDSAAKGLSRNQHRSRVPWRTAY